MKFLIDECLHTSLVQAANNAGYEAHHVVHLGLGGTEDHQLMKRIRDEEFTFGTNNALDFQKLFAKESFHAGLIIIVPNAPPEIQRELFMAALAEVEENEPVNCAIHATRIAANLPFRDWLFGSSRSVMKAKYQKKLAQHAICILLSATGR